MAVLQGMTISVLVVSEKHILQQKFRQKLPIDNQKIKNNNNKGRNLLILGRIINDLIILYLMFLTHPFHM